MVLNVQEMSVDTGKDFLAPDVSSSNFASLRRAKSLDRRVTESSMTVSLENKISPAFNIRLTNSVENGTNFLHFWAKLFFFFSFCNQLKKLKS